MEAFLREHLVRHRGNSPHTCDSYAYSFQSLFEFASQKLKVAPSALMLEQLDASLISSFLEYLESTRGNSAETRNIRLAAIRSFFRFLQHREPAAIEQVRRILAIPFKKTDHRLVPYLAQEEMQALLDAPDPSTRMGVRDRAILHLALCAGPRVSELTGLRIDDVAPQAASIRVRGKGRRERALPLWKTTAAALRAWLAIRGPVASPELFVPAVCPSVVGVSPTFYGGTPKRRIDNARHCAANKSHRTSCAIPARWWCSKQLKTFGKFLCGWDTVI
jgi:site-specific recombinase XerC